MNEEDKSIATTGHSSNLTGVPGGLLSSASFSEFPISLSIRGVREAHADLFDELNHCRTLDKARTAFVRHMDVLFALGPEKKRTRRFHASYLQLLKDWRVDSNGLAGAVMKGWVESRFGLFPTYHKMPIRRFNSPEWIAYVEEKMCSRFNNNTIFTQLDLLYEFSQWVLPRFVAVGKKHLTLYRGTNDLRDQQLILKIDDRTAIVRLNNLLSFTSNRSIADEFGDIIIKAEVPTAKLLFFDDLVLPPLLRGESEYIVIGGDYRVDLSYF